MAEKHSRKPLSLFHEDAEQWEQDGMSIQDQDALVLALWRWYRGRPDTSGLSTISKVLYSTITKRLAASEKIYQAKKSYGKKGANNRWMNHSQMVNGSAMSDQTCPIPTPIPTPTPTPIPTSTPINIESMGDTPMPPALTNDKKLTRFVKPTEQEIIDYCREKGYTKVNAADFIDFYESNGWMVGRNKMKNWRSTVSRWERMDYDRGKNSGTGRTDEDVHTPENVKEEDYDL